MSNDPKTMRGGAAVYVTPEGAITAPRPRKFEHPPQMMNAATGASPLAG